MENNKKIDTAFCEDCRQFKAVRGRIHGKPYCDACLNSTPPWGYGGGYRVNHRQLVDGGGNSWDNVVRELEDR